MRFRGILLAGYLLSSCCSLALAGDHVRGALYFNARGEPGSTTLTPGGPQLRSAVGADAAWSPFGLNDVDISGSFYMALDDDNSGFENDTAQGSIGVQWRPFSSYLLSLSALRVLKLGDDAREGWLTAVSSYAATGADWNPTQSKWPYASMSAYASYLWDTPEFASAAFDGRAGYAWAVSQDWALIPHVVAAGQFVDDNSTQSSLVEAGAGLLLRHWTCDDPRAGRSCTVEIHLQYRYPVSRDRLGNDDGSVVLGVIFGAY